MLINLWRTLLASNSSSTKLLAATPKTTGERAEDLACKFLIDQGLKLKDRNYRTRRGEIDLVMQSNDAIIFVEVRYRSSNKYGSPGDSITAAKRQKIVAAAQQYLVSHGYGDNASIRLDAVLITPASGDYLNCTINWIKNILT